MHDDAEPLSGLIEFMVWDEQGNGIARFRYYSSAPHRYGNGHFAGRFAGGIYTCGMWDGTKSVEADCANGVGVTVFDEQGAPLHTFRTAGQSHGRCEIEPASGKLFAWHPNGQQALVATFSQALYEAWNVPFRVSPRAALSPLTHASFAANAEPWLQEAARSESEAERLHAERGLAALHASRVVEMDTILAWMLLMPPTLDYDASLLCQLLMSADPTVQARAHDSIATWGPEHAGAAIRLALMRNEDRSAQVQEWVAKALLRLGTAGLDELKEVDAQDCGFGNVLKPTIQWLQSELGPQ